MVFKTINLEVYHRSVVGTVFVAGHDVRGHLTSSLQVKMALTLVVLKKSKEMCANIGSNWTSMQRYRAILQSSTLIIATLKDGGHPLYREESPPRGHH